MNNEKAHCLDPDRPCFYDLICTDCGNTKVAKTICETSGIEMMFCECEGLMIPEFNYQRFDSMIWKELIKPRANIHEKDDSGYVYILLANGKYKIGKAKQLLHRVKSIQSMNGEPTTLVYSHKTNNRHKLETALHKQFTDKGLHGEWFQLSESDVEKAIEYIVHYCLNR